MTAVEPNMSGPLVSMVMATNRVSPFLEEALDSMMGQTYEPIEIIVVDDGCAKTEELRSILVKYPSVTLIHQAASGPSVARNVGVSRAKGQLIGFFDDDDRYPSDWVAEHVRCHLEHPEVVLSYAGRVQLIDVNGNRTRVDRLRQADMHDFFRRDVAVMAGALVVRRETFIRVGGLNPLIRLAEDLDFMLRCAWEGPFACVSDLGYDYRIHPNNSTRQHRELVAHIEAVIDFHAAMSRLRGRGDLVADLRRGRAANGRYAFWCASGVARSALHRRSPGQAMAELMWAFRVAPGAPLSWARRRLGGRRS